MNWVGFYTLLHREVYRFAKLFKQTVIPHVVTTTLHIIVFGFSLGASIKDVQGIEFVKFIIPGLAQMGIITNAYANSSSSLYMARIERSIENLLVAPLHYWEIVLSLVAGGVFRGLAVGVATLAVSAIFVDLPMPHVFWLLLSWTVSSALFSAVGVIVGIIAESWDQISIISTFILTPFIYLGGTFYSLDMIPDFWRKLTYFNPAFYCVDSTRYALLGIHQINPYYSLAIISAVTLVMIMACTGLIKSGYKLIH